VDDVDVNSSFNFKNPNGKEPKPDPGRKDTFMITMILILQAVTAIAVLGFVLYLAWRTRQFKKQQQKILLKIKGQRFWRINIARPEFVSRWLRITPYEATGVLIDGDDCIKIQGFWQKTGKMVESTFLKSELNVQWLGNPSMRSGNLYWAKLTTARGDLLICADTGMNALRSREGLEDIFRNAFPDYALSDEQVVDFALEKNPRTRLAMIALFSLMAFALIDTYVISKFELIDHQLANILLNPIILGVLLVGYGVGLYALYRYFIHGNVPARESWVLSGFLVGIFLLSLAPLAKRFDQIFAKTPSQDYSYRVVDEMRLEPLDASLQLPNLRFPRSREYWAQFTKDADYKIPFLRGPLGLWQLDHEKFDKPILDFYQKNKN
jgi:hypothetical protein